MDDYVEDPVPHYGSRWLVIKAKTTSGTGGLKWQCIGNCYLFCIRVVSCEQRSHCTGSTVVVNAQYCCILMFLFVLY